MTVVGSSVEGMRCIPVLLLNLEERYVVDMEMTGQEEINLSGA